MNIYTMGSDIAQIPLSVVFQIVGYRYLKSNFKCDFKYRYLFHNYHMIFFVLSMRHSGTWRYEGSKSKSLKSDYLMMFQLKIGYFGPVNTIFCWVRWVWSEFMPFKETWNYQIFPILCFLGVKLTIVAKPQIPNNIPFWDTMYEP